MQNGQDNALLPYGKFAVCKIFNIKSEMLLFHSECFSTKVRTQQVVRTLISIFFVKIVIKSCSIVLQE